MKIKDGYILREIAEIPVAVPVNDAARSFNGMMRLNSTGAFLWRLLERKMEKEQLAEACVSRYRIDRSDAEKHVTEFLDLLRKNGLLDE